MNYPANYLKFHPWHKGPDANKNVLDNLAKRVTTYEQFEQQANKLSETGQLIVAEPYANAEREYLSTHVDAETTRSGELCFADKLALWKLKQAEEEAAETKALCHELRNVKLRDGYRLKSLTLDQLRTVKQAIVIQNQMLAKSAKELREVVKAENPTQSFDELGRVQRTEPLPQSVVFEHEEYQLTGLFLSRVLYARDPFSTRFLHFLKTRYGLAAIDARRFGQS
jgi:hypothetical protein